MHRDECPDPLPQRKQRAESPLVLRPNERPPKLQSGAHPIEKRLAILEQSSGVKVADLIRAGQAIGAGDLTPVRIPGEQMKIFGIEAVQIEASSGAFSSGSKRDFAQAAD